ncbi:MAG: SDR family oxidoreductase [Verrucomicrobiales bacterium]|jgi:dTDP-4-dehydrorhamnose reductase
MKRIAITGVTGRLGGALARHHRALGHEVIALDRKALDLAQSDRLMDQLGALDFDALINPAGITGLEACEDEPELARRVNAGAPALMAVICRERSIPFLHVSTDYVFDGIVPGERRETDPAEPISHYGVTKLAGEQAVLAANPEAWVARVSWLFGPDRPGFVDMILDRANAGEPIAAIADKDSCPTYVDDAVEAFDHLLAHTDDPGGVIHVCNQGPTTWYDYAQEILRLRGGEIPKVQRQALAEMKAFRAPRPKHTAMNADHLQELTGHQMRPWQDALSDYMASVSS